MGISDGIVFGAWLVKNGQVTTTHPGAHDPAHRDFEKKTSKRISQSVSKLWPDGWDRLLVSGELGAESLLQLGIALWVNSAWLLLTLLAAVAVMSLVVIPREERYLEARFSSDYSSYKASIRRWL